MYHLIQKNFGRYIFVKNYNELYFIQTINSDNFYLTA